MRFINEDIFLIGKSEKINPTPTLKTPPTTRPYRQTTIYKIYIYMYLYFFLFLDINWYSIGAGSGRFGSQHSGDNFQIELAKERQPNLQDRTDLKGPQHAKNDPTVRGLPRRSEDTCTEQHEKKPQVRCRRERAVAVPLHHANVRTWRTWLVQPMRVGPRLWRVHHHQARLPGQ